MLGVKVVGHISTHKEKAYLLDKGEPVTFHTAFDNGEFRTFYSRASQWPSTTATQLGIDYSFMRNATEEEVRAAVKKYRINVLAEVEA